MIDEDENNELNSLYVDQEEIYRRRLVTALEGLIGIDSESGEMVRLSRYEKLNSKEKVITYLLYRRVVDMLGDLDEDEQLEVDTQAISEVTKVSSNGVRRFLSDLDFVDTDKKQGGYFIPDNNIPEAIDYLTH